LAMFSGTVAAVRVGFFDHGTATTSPLATAAARMACEGSSGTDPMGEARAHSAIGSRRATKATRKVSQRRRCHEVSVDSRSVGAWKVGAIAVVPIGGV
jgi:hypothetical protein